MRITVMCLVLFATLASQFAQAGQQPASTTTEAPGGDLGPPGGKPESAWTAPSRKLVLKLHPLPIALGAASGALLLPLELELAATPNLGVYGLATPFLGAVSGIGLGGGLRVYFSGHAPDGFWVGGQLLATLPALLVAGPSGGAGLDFQPYLGYQWVFGNGFTVGVGAGVSLVALASQTNPRFPLVLQVPVGFAW